MSNGGRSTSWEERRSGRRRHPDDARNDYEVDYARVIHSSAFRRLQGKTQILALGDDDFYRTRLTHSLEVSQIAQGVVQQLRRGGAASELMPPAALISAVSLTHDLGHPPFGHGGELALNYCMRDAGGFEGNAQTLRIVARLEPYVERFGADLTRRTLLGALKYPVPRSAATRSELAPSLAAGTTSIAVLDRGRCTPAKAYYDTEAEVVSWLLTPFRREDVDRFTGMLSRAGRHAKSLHKTFDCSIMDVADDVAYGVHDLEDAVALGLVDEEGFRTALPADVCPGLVEALTARPLAAGTGEGYDGLVAALFGADLPRKAAVGRLVHHLLQSVRVQVDDGFAEPLLAHSAVLSSDGRGLLDRLQKLVVDEVIESAGVQHLEFKGQRMVVAVFEALASEARRLLPQRLLAAYREADGDLRVISDHVAAMTDGALMKTYERLFSPRMGSVFDRL